MRKVAIIGASYLQEPLIQKAKSMGFETHVFAWACGDVGEKSADFFYPISIVEKDAILEKCVEIGIDGICSIASDLASITVNYISSAMGLIGNSLECTERSTNKYAMRKSFEENLDPSPRSYLVKSLKDLEGKELSYPIIVKPVDRSGSRGITKLLDESGLFQAIESAIEQSFQKEAVVEEFVEGQEYSVECISWNGKHHFLAMTKKYTTGAPHFIETGHLEPAMVEISVLEQVKKIVYHALDSLKITNGASHSELKITDDGTIRLIEIGGRMGGDFIGSNLVELSTGIDYTRAVLETCLGIEPKLEQEKATGAAAVRFVFSNEDLQVLERLKREHPLYLVAQSEVFCTNRPIMDSSSRYGFYLMKADTPEDLLSYLPKE
ncbi:MAG: ATP-grasp domain-containing protein [Eubacteriales bacterium]|nr:ATP-grasp domain-containing protein [Eubacteriales bacterium]